MPVVRGIDIETEASPAAEPVGIVELDELTTGYGLFHQFKTVWAYQRHCIYWLAIWRRGHWFTAARRSYI